MRKRYTTTYFLLVFAWALLWGPGLTGALAQSECGMYIDYFYVYSTEVTNNGVVYKQVEVLIKNPHHGQADKFYYKFDGAMRDGSEDFYAYDSKTEILLIPVDVKKITFYDFNANEACKVDTIPNFEANICSFPLNLRPVIYGDCYNNTAVLTVDESITIDSVVWLRNGESEPVWEQMTWSKIPPGSYEIFVYDNRGCEGTAGIYFCLDTTYAGDDNLQQYCLGEDDTLNLYDLLSPEVDQGGFFTESFDALDPSIASQLTYDAEDTKTYFYIATAVSHVPDTSQFTIDARDCSVCAYELISAERHCADPEMIEITIGGGTTEDTTFRVTLPDGTVETQTFFTPFQIDFPYYLDTLELAVQMDSPTGTCDSVILIDPIASPMIQINPSEILIQGDSVGIEVSVGQGVAPYDLDVFVGEQQQFWEFGEDESHQFDFIQSQDTAYLIATDARGCMGMDTLALTPGCVIPDVTILRPDCGNGKGRVTVENTELPAGSQIAWQDTAALGLWERTDLSPGTYHYTVTYDHCTVEGGGTIVDGLENFPEVSLYNDCPIDGQVRIFIQDSATVRQWSLGETVLSYFSGIFPANRDFIFEIETVDGCIDTALVRGDEPPWLDRIDFQEPNRLSAKLAVDPGSLDDYGWSFMDSVLCTTCEDYQGESMLQAGTYVFFAEQFPGCRADTFITIDEPEHAFLMPNAITPGKGRNNLLQIFDPLNQMVSIMELQVYDRFGNILFEKFDFYPDDDASINWPNGMTTELPNVIVCIAKIKCRDGDEVTMAQDVLILR